MQRSLSLGELVRVTSLDDTVSNGVILEIYPGGRSFMVAVPHPSRKYVIKAVTNERLERLTREMVTEDEYNDAREFQNQMDSVVDSDGIKIMGRTSGGKTNKRRRRRSSTKRKRRT